MPCLLIIPLLKTTIPLGVGSAFNPGVLQNGNLASNLRSPHLPVELVLTFSDSQNTKHLPLALADAHSTCLLGFVFYSSASLRTITYMSRLPSIYSLSPRHSWIFCNALSSPSPSAWLPDFGYFRLGYLTASHVPDTIGRASGFDSVLQQNFCSLLM